MPGTESRELYTDVRIEEEDTVELCIAAAIHDCAHLPVSHATERAILSVKGDSKGVRHEERIVPLLLLHEDAYFGEVRNLLRQRISDPSILHQSLIRICLLVGHDSAKDEALSCEGFRWPKRAMFQMLCSALDMDRLDFIMRDALKTQYLPVLRMSKMRSRFVEGLVLVGTKMIGKPAPRPEDVELCLLDSYLTKAFNMLVARVLLYNYVYFNRNVRALEGALTYAIGELLRSGDFVPQPLHLPFWSGRESQG